jgi:FtsZ-interacting cell division protein ZipA
MAELRWILLLAGLLFIAGLAAWELRRPRQGRRDVLDAPERSEPEVGHLGIGPGAHDGLTVHTEAAAAPIHGASMHAAPMHAAPFRAAYQERMPAEPSGGRVDIPALEPPLVVSFDEPVLTGEHEVPVLEPMHAEPRRTQLRYAEPMTQAEPMARAETGADEPSAAAPALTPAVAAAGDAGPRSDTPVEPARQATVLPAVEPVTPIVDWPPEAQRHIISVRVVGLGADRMSGRPLRQALAACGFAHGRFGIFHQPGADGRALISAANLSKPGVFDPATMDFQRFRGLGLFAVLPGPLPPAAALDHLLDTAGDLAQRLQARLQDEHGMPLDEERLEEMARVVHGMSQNLLRAEPAA